ncbi:hypothetical protein CASFOL_038970 [Castilleja foliolosa]|uniref:F-box associated beta-propeller type 1 domain-containing protein n=1 Tax=Castilleja foliolosa TaxID=1961234 RepID=A0ABD3BJ35_9LAMI
MAQFTFYPTLHQIPPCLVYVYYVKRGVWKKIEWSSRHYGLPANYCGVFLNGAIHWLVLRGEDCAVIVALDLDDDVFFEIPAPSVADMNDFFFGSLSVLGGCLCVVADTPSNSEGTDVWVMKDYGAAESWWKFTVSGYDFVDLFFKPLCFVGDCEEEVVLLVEGPPRLIVYNVNEGTLRDMVVVDRVQGTFVDGGTFVESRFTCLIRIGGATLIAQGTSNLEQEVDSQYS